MNTPNNSPAPQDSELTSMISDVVKSWIGFRPRGSHLDSFTHAADGTVLTVDEAYAKLDEFVAREMADDVRNAERDAENDRWERQVEAEVAATSWLPE